jgi:hypothetical protein
VQVQDLGPVDQALAGEGDHVRLVAAPCGQRDGPLVGAPQLGDLLAGLDRAAVDGAGNQGRELTGDDGHHGLVEQGQTCLDPAFLYQRTALEEQRERNQVGVTGAPADLDRSGRRTLPSRVVTGVELLARHRKQ